jgi:hypothetical protein
MGQPVSIFNVDMQDRDGGRASRDNSAALLLDRIRELSGLFSAQQQLAGAALATNDLAALGASAHEQRAILRQRGRAVDAYVRLRARAKSVMCAPRTGAR